MVINITAVTTPELFNAATIGAAQALLRDDLDKLEVGARADIVLVNLEDPGMIPARDPLRSLLYTAAERAVSDLFVDDHQLVAERKVLTLNRLDVAHRWTKAQARMIDAVPNHDLIGRNAQDITPISLPRQ